MEFFRILIKLNFYKLFNIFIAYSSYGISSVFKKVIVWGKPFTLSIEPINSCNLQCLECPTGNDSLLRQKQSFDVNLYQKIIDENKTSLIYLLLYFQGEPFMNKNIFEIISYASKSGIYTMTSTNGHFITVENAKKIVDSKLDKIIISLDGTTQETYEQYRKNGSFETVISGIEALVAEKKMQKSKRPFIELQFLVLKTNEHQISAIKQLGKRLEVDSVRLKTAQIYDYKNGNPLIPTIDKYSRYRKNNDGTYSFKRNPANTCWRLWSSAVVSVNGSVVPCCYDKDTRHVMGSLENSSMTQIWKNANYQAFRKQIITSKKDVMICEECIV
ncbi:MAG: hypothetical protein A2W98_04860 [Bacteroidetes bacterium GWF2_33_38]|nr:MAG: hypothetical protein A2W98_04860 [Bacteroidetes bacterium GWF2_33_38]OFY76143.1 MAG: hypothetical protein A2265_07675 [Bacteroidetes bacterium RIFOXYA12_FULL_33_9]OFY90739.1 MAG: hypothetical protein A2236_05530 [Bacteroidetes bacterium RIFOXYA2_FULL_33_7]